MNKPILVIVLAGVLISSGCANNSSPEKVLRSFLDKMEEKKIDEAAKLATQNSQPFIKQMQAEATKRKEGTKIIPEEVIFEHPKKRKSFELGKARITGNLATVVVTYKTEFEGEPNTTHLKWALEKEDGKWKVIMVPSPRFVHHAD